MTQNTECKHIKKTLRVGEGNSTLICTECNWQMSFEKRSELVKTCPFCFSDNLSGDTLRQVCDVCGGEWEKG